jgi:hypothetical protein
MVHKLFENFLDDFGQYGSCEQYWHELVTRIADESGQHGQWKRWIPLHYPNGTPMERDGNPMFDGRSQQLDRAFRIMQHRSTSDEIELAAWITSNEEEFAELPRHELVINMSLSEESAQIAEELLRKWMAPATTPDDMRAFIAMHQPRNDDQTGG